ncbi:hypothetical protein R83H12_02181 [Fibrobacteria bacterium R8-3-H12]
MSAQKFKKGLAGFLFLSMLLIFACSTKNEPEISNEGSSSSMEQSSSDNQSGVIPSSNSSPSSSSKIVISSSSEVAGSSDSEVEDSSDSAVASSSSRTASSSSRAASSSSRAASSSSRAASSSSVAASSSSIPSSSSVGAAAKCTLANRTQTNIGPDVSTQKFDITIPSGDGPFPVIMFAFGGAFTAGSKTVGTPFSNGGSHGYATVKLNYRLASSGKPSWPGLVEDLLAEIRYLRAHATELCLDPNKFVMTGFSAGGYLTGLIASISGSSSPKHPFSETASDAGVSSEVQAAVSCAALSDFTKLNSQQQELGGNWMMPDHYANGQALNQLFGIQVQVPPPAGSAIETKLRDSNPFTYVTQANCAKIPPIMMVHGTGDNLVPWKQSEILVNKIKEVCGDTKAQLVKHSGGHADCPSGNEAAIFDFLDRSLGIK